MDSPTDRSYRLLFDHYGSYRIALPNHTGRVSTRRRSSELIVQFPFVRFMPVRASLAIRGPMPQRSIRVALDMRSSARDDGGSSLTPCGHLLFIKA